MTSSGDDPLPFADSPLDINVLLSPNARRPSLGLRQSLYDTVK
jgi:hypothetical protein